MEFPYILTLIRSISITIYNTPYTYLIGWSKHGKYYYGVRYAKDCRPEELWKNYFTSSKHVNHFRNKHGDPDIIQIRKIFNNSDDARLWENKVLLKIDAVNNKQFLNHTNNISPPVFEFDRGKNFEEYNKNKVGKTYDELYGKEKSDKMKTKLSLVHKGKNVTKESRNKMSIKAKANRNGVKNVKGAYRLMGCIKCKKEMIYSNYMRWHNHT